MGFHRRELCRGGPRTEREKFLKFFFRFFCEKNLFDFDDTTKKYFALGRNSQFLGTHKKKSGTGPTRGPNYEKIGQIWGKMSKKVKKQAVLWDKIAKSETGLTSNGQFLTFRSTEV